MREEDFIALTVPALGRLEAEVWFELHRSGPVLRRCFHLPVPERC